MGVSYPSPYSLVAPEFVNCRLAMTDIFRIEAGSAAKKCLMYFASRKPSDGQNHDGKERWVSPLPSGQVSHDRLCRVHVQWPA
jgi:hypothetical protein